MNVINYLTLYSYRVLLTASTIAYIRVYLLDHHHQYSHVLYYLSYAQLSELRKDIELRMKRSVQEGKTVSPEVSTRQLSPAFTCTCTCTCSRLTTHTNLFVLVYVCALFVLELSSTRIAGDLAGGAGARPAANGARRLARRHQRTLPFPSLFTSESEWIRSDQ